MEEIIFATGNKRKVEEARLGCDKFGVKLKPVKFNIKEIQSYDPIEISLQKVEDAYICAGKKPVVINDNSWDIPALNGFPGGYMKDVTAWFTVEDWLTLMSNKKDRRIYSIETIIYKDEKEVKIFSKKCPGFIVEKPRGKSDITIERMAEFEGSTIAESHNQGKFSYEPEDHIWFEFAKWYSENKK